MFLSLSLSHLGDSSILISSKTFATYRGQLILSSISTEAKDSIVFSVSVSLISGTFSSRLKIAERSLATPMCESASDRFGVMAISRITSFKFKALDIFSPGNNLSLSTIIPE